MDKLTAMTAFVRVVEAGGFGKAADELEAAKANVSRQVQYLEEQLGVKLLERSTRRVALTEEGDAYYRRVQRFLADMQSLDDDARQLRQEARGRVRVEVPPGLLTARLMPALPAFLDSFPDIELEWHVRSHHVDPISAGIDCSLRLGEVQEQQLVARRVGKIRLRLCAAPDYLERQGTPQEPAALASAHRLIGFSSTVVDRVMPWALSTQGQTGTADGPWHTLVTDARAALVTALNGGGVALLPDYLASSPLAQGTLQELLPGWTVPSLPLSVVYPQNHYLAAKVRVFIDWVVETLADLR